jgi:L-malate glycosyltransferase
LGSKKKILILGDVNSTHLKKWINALTNEYQLGVFSFNYIDQPSRKSLLDLKVQLFCKEETKSSSKLTYFFQFTRLKNAVKLFNPDIIHAHYASSYGFFGALLKKNNFIVSAWGSDVFEFPKKSFLHKKIIQFVFKKATVLMSTSNIMAQEMKLYTNKNVVITPFGVPTDIFVPKSVLRNDKFIVGTVKSLEHVYGIDLLIHSFKEFNEIYPNSECYIYGRGSLESDYMSLVESLNLSSVVKFKGFIPNDIVPDVLNTLDVFCALSRSESFGVAVLEASSCCVPVIVNDVGGLKEVAVDNQTGFVVDAFDSEQVVQKMIFLAKNRKYCIELGNNGREFVLNNFSWSASVHIMKSEYEKINSLNN